MTVRTFRTLLLISMAMSLAGIASGIFAIAVFLPPELQAYEKHRADAMPTWELVAVPITAVPGLIGLVGLWRLRRWARTLSVAALIFSLLWLPFAGPIVHTGISYFLYAASN